MGVLTFGECEGAYEELMKVSRRASSSRLLLSIEGARRRKELYKTLRTPLLTSLCSSPSLGN
jgi:hypothetical protein